MLNNIYEDIVVRSVDLSSVSENVVKQDGVCLIDNKVYILYLNTVTRTNARLIKHLEKLYDNIVKSDIESKRKFPLFIENNVIQKHSYLKSCNWFVVQADGYPLGSKTFNYTHSGFSSFEDACSEVSNFLSKSVSEDKLISKVISGYSTRDLFIK